MLTAVLLWLGVGLAAAAEPVVTVVTDFEDDSVVAQIADFERLTGADCAVGFGTIPARGQRSLRVQIGATRPGSLVGVGLRFRLAEAFSDAREIAGFVWIDEKEVEVRYRLRDATGRLFATRPKVLTTHRRWVRVTGSLADGELEPLDEGDDAPAWPIEIAGFDVRARQAGRQQVLIDDIEVEHSVEPVDSIRGRFRFERPTQLFPPGPIRAGLELENLSRSDARDLRVELNWVRSDGTVFATDRASVNLPASGTDYRSRQVVEATQRVREPGALRLVAEVRAARWSRPAVFETGLTVTPSNRGLPRGRETFFGIRTNLLEEPLEDQRRELELLSELGIQLVALETPWRLIEPAPGSRDFARLEELLRDLAQRDVMPVVRLTSPPAWLPEDGDERRARERQIVLALARELREWLPGIALTADDVDDAYRAWFRELAAALAEQEYSGQLWPPAGPPPAPDLEAAARLTRTEGDVRAATALLRDRPGWTPRDRWSHVSAPMNGVGQLADAVGVFGFLVAAAESGVGGVLWYDLRDDTNDPRRVEQMRGLVRRDFSPKSTALAFASAIGMLNGLSYTGRGDGAPATLDVARFFSPRREVLVVTPRGAPPRAVTALTGAAGDLAAFDFERRPLTVLASRAAPPLVLCEAKPFYVVFTPQRSLDQSALRLEPAWLQVPRSVRLADRGRLALTLRAPRDLQRSFIGVSLPRDAGISSSVSARALKLEAGQSETIEIELTRSAAANPSAVILTLEVNLEGEKLALPIEIEPAIRVGAANDVAALLETAPTPLPATEKVGVAAAPGPECRIARTGDTLLVAITAPGNAAGGTSLQIGLAGGAAAPARLTLADAWQEPSRGDDAPGWEVTPLDGPQGRPVCVVRIPLPPGAGEALRLDVRVEEPAAASFLPPRVWRLGGGAPFEVADGYRWLLLE